MLTQRLWLGRDTKPQIHGRIQIGSENMEWCKSYRITLRIQNGANYGTIRRNRHGDKMAEI